MSNLLLRLLTAVILIPLLFAAIEWRLPWGVWLWVLLAQTTGLREWMNMTLPGESIATRALGVLIGLAIAQTAYFAPQALMLCLCGGTLLVLCWFLFRYQPIETVATRVSLMICGIVYAGLLVLPLALFKTRAQGDGAAWIYICLTLAWFSDTGAYFAGRFLGGRWPQKLYADVSPKKTRIGAVGGLLASILALAIAKLWYLKTLSTLDVFLIAVPANVLGQVGDLCESLIKRSVGVKDSGALLPGHGGMLDRIDALIFVVPYVYAYATLLH